MDVKNNSNYIKCGVGCALFLVFEGTPQLTGILSAKTSEYLIFQEVNGNTESIIHVKNQRNTPNASDFPTIVWNSTQKLKPHYCLFSEECINIGEVLISRAKHVDLSFLKNGDLQISFVSNSFVFWSSETKNLGGEKACLKRNGEFIMMDDKNQTIFSVKPIFNATENSEVFGCIFDIGAFVAFENDKEILRFGLKDHISDH